MKITNVEGIILESPYENKAPEGSEEAALLLAGAARFLAAHTPTRRELPQVLRIATRLRRGEVLFEEA